MLIKKIALIICLQLLISSLGCAKPSPNLALLSNQNKQHMAHQHNQQGISYANIGDYNNAISEFKRSVDIRPTVNAYANLGGVYMQVGKNNLAMDSLNRAESLNPYDTLTLYNLTALHSKLDNTDIALVYLDKTLAHGFKNFDAIRFDPDLTNIRGEPEFRKVLEKNGVFLQ